MEILGRFPGKIFSRNRESVVTGVVYQMHILISGYGQMVEIAGAGRVQICAVPRGRYSRSGCRNTWPNSRRNISRNREPVVYSMHRLGGMTKWSKSLVLVACSATAPCVRQALHHSKKRIQTPVPRGRSTKIISMIEWIWTSRFSTKNSLFAAFREKFTYTGSETGRETRPFSMCGIADLGNPLVARNLKRCVRKTISSYASILGDI